MGNGQRGRECLWEQWEVSVGKQSLGNALFIVFLGAADPAVLFASRVHGGAMFELTPHSIPT